MSKPLWFSQLITSQIPILQAKQQVVCTLADIEAHFLCSSAQLSILSPDTQLFYQIHTYAPLTEISLVPTLLGQSENQLPSLVSLDLVV